jgi:hypothetical protein
MVDERLRLRIFVIDMSDIIEVKSKLVLVTCSSYDKKVDVESIR